MQFVLQNFIESVTFACCVLTSLTVVDPHGTRMLYACLYIYIYKPTQEGIDLTRGSLKRSGQNVVHKRIHCGRVRYMDDRTENGEWE